MNERGIGKSEIYEFMFGKEIPSQLLGIWEREREID